VCIDVFRVSDIGPQAALPSAGVTVTVGVATPLEEFVLLSE
jgi:hypothetical protein